jgi:ABC-type lipoprotein export system ATPase subunit
VDLASQKDLAGYRRRHIGLVFQLHNLLPQLSAIQNVEVAMFGTGLTRRQRRDRARSLLADVDLAGMRTRPPTRLSGGERQRVAIARALANEPELLLADEPTGSLDERSVDLVLDLFSRLRAERPGMTMIIVTHDIRVAGTADRIIRLRDGRVDHAHGAIGAR